MTDKQMMTSNAGREVGGRGLVPVGETPVVLPAALAGEVDELTGRFAEHIGEGLMAASVAIGLDVLDRMMQAEVAGLAGPKGRHDADRTHVRHGSEAGSVTLGGRKVPRSAGPGCVAQVTNLRPCWRPMRWRTLRICWRNTWWGRSSLGCLLAGMGRRSSPSAPPLKPRRRGVEVVGVAPVRYGDDGPVRVVDVTPPRRRTVADHVHRRVHVR
jgi:hypothetical protein